MTCVSPRKARPWRRCKPGPGSSWPQRTPRGNAGPAALPLPGPHRDWGAPRSGTYSTRAHRLQATAPQRQQARTQRPHRARSHWPHTAVPSSARTQEEQALVTAPDRSVRRKHHLSAPQEISGAGGRGAASPAADGADRLPVSLPPGPQDNLPESAAHRPFLAHQGDPRRPGALRARFPRLWVGPSFHSRYLGAGHRKDQLLPRWLVRELP